MSNKQETLKMQTCVLRVNIHCHCDGCKKKIRKLLHKIDGVYSTQVNAEQGRVTVTGNVDPAKLIKTLEKSGKHAELWGPQNLVGNFKNMQIGTDSGAGKDKSQKGGGKGQQQQQHVQFKGHGNMKMMPNKLDQKNVKFSAQEDDFDGSSGELGGDFDEDGEFDDDYEDGDKEFGWRHGQSMPAKMMPMKGNSGQYMPHGPGFSDKKGGGRGGGNGKKGGSGAIEIPVLMKGKGGNNDGKNGNGGKKVKGGQGKEWKDGKNGPGKKGKDKKKDGKDKSGGKSGGGWLLGFLRRSKSGREIMNDEYDFDIDGDMLGGGGGKNHGNGGKKGGGKGQVVHDINKMKQGFNEFDGHNGPRNKGQMSQMGKMQMGPMGPVGPMGNYGRMDDMPAVQGHQAQPEMSGGYYKGMGPANPYSQRQQQQQQYMAMLMNQQQRQNGNAMYQPMMYAGPHPAVNYMPPPMPPPLAADPLTHIFSDENTESCSIM